MKKNKALVIDTSGFIGGFMPSLKTVKIFTVPSVINEIESNIILKEIIFNAINKGLIEVLEPTKNSVLKVIEVSKITGDLSKLSKTDIDILALGLDLKHKYEIVILSDDYAIQNTSLKIGLKFKNIREKGIRQLINWVKYCPGCYKTYEDNLTEYCDVCGSKLKLKPKKRSG
ncbi:MAG: NOB1 family endonuclease [Candidatus Odinarchaeia archaeon]